MMSIWQEIHPTAICFISGKLLASLMASNRRLVDYIEPLSFRYKFSSDKSPKISLRLSGKRYFQSNSQSNPEGN